MYEDDPIQDDGRVPPQDLEAEAAVLSAVLLSTSSLDAVRAVLAPKQFYCNAHQKIFEAICSITDSGTPLDILTLRAWLSSKGWLDRVGGSRYLVEILDKVPAVYNVAEYARMVAEKAALRDVIDLGRRITAEAYNAPNADVLLASVNGHIEKAIGKAARVCRSATPLRDLTGPALARGIARHEGRESPIPVTHQDRADSLGGGYWEGLHMLISGTGAGKSQLAIQDILTAAKAGVPCMYIGLELDANQVAMRLLAEESRSSWSKMYLGKASRESYTKAEQAREVLDQLPIYTEFSGPQGWPLSRLEPAVARMRKLHPEGPMLVVLDYLQLIAPEPGERRADARERIGVAAYLCRALAVKYHCAIVLVSSTARANYGQMSGEAIKSAGLTIAPSNQSFAMRRVVLVPDALVGAGKESGEIEAAADSVTVLVKWPTLSDQGHRVVLAVLAKGRATGASWCALEFVYGQRFVHYPVADMDDLPPLKPNGASKVSGDDYEARVLEAVRANPGLKTKRGLCDKVPGKVARVLEAINSLLASGRIVINGNVFETACP